VAALCVWTPVKVQSLCHAVLLLLLLPLLCKQSVRCMLPLGPCFCSLLCHQVTERQLQLMLAALPLQLQAAKPQEVSNTLVACVKLRHLPAQLLSALEQPQRLPAFLAAADAQALSNTAWACGQLGHQSSILIPGLVQESLLRLQQDRRCFIPQALCNLCCGSGRPAGARAGCAAADRGMC
jgi:hypothetical protein